MAATKTIRLATYAASELELRSEVIDDMDSPEVAAALRAYNRDRGVLVVPRDTAQAEAIWRGLIELGNICDALAEEPSISPEERTANRHACQGLATASMKVCRLLGGTL